MNAGNQVRVGNVLEFKGKLVVVRRAQAVKPGKGGAFNQVYMCVYVGVGMFYGASMARRLNQLRAGRVGCV